MKSLMSDGLRSFVVNSLFAVLLMAVPREASGCACCTDFGQRNVGVQRLDAYKRDELERTRFLSEAELFLGARGPEDVQGISHSEKSSDSGRYKLSLTKHSDRWSFDFRGADAGTENIGGVLTLTMPTVVSVFEIDPRREVPSPQDGHGPVLYKEWRLTSSAVGSGIFAAGISPGVKITLIVQGHGNSCTSAEDFTQWTLVIHGPTAEYSFFGGLVPPQEGPIDP